MPTKIYRIAKWFIIANYFVIPLSFIFALFFILGPLVIWHDSSFVEMAFFFLVGMGFIVGGIYSIRILPQMKGTIQISERQIIQEHFDGTSISIWWQEDFVIRNRPILGRLELISQDGQRIIRIEQQIEKYQEIAEMISFKQMEKQIGQNPGT